MIDPHSRLLKLDIPTKTDFDPALDEISGAE
jgi:hypothetical protein